MYSPFNANRLDGGNVAFEAAAGKHLYVGEFVYVKYGTVTLRRQLDEARTPVGVLFPELKDSLSAADFSIVKNSFVFICTP